MAESRDTRPQYRLIGQNYQTPDIVAKVTGRARYAEDYRAEGMLFVKLLLNTPVGIDMIVQSLEEGRRVDRGLTANV